MSTRHYPDDGWSAGPAPGVVLSATGAALAAAPAADDGRGVAARRAARTRVAVLSNTTWYLYNFRFNLMRALRADGYDVVAIGPRDGYEDRLSAEGFRHIAWRVDQAGIDPLAELECVLDLRRILRAEGIDALLSYTPKGNLYGTAAASTLAIPVIANISGLGRVFVRGGPMSWLVRGLYWGVLRHAAWVFFQNQDDMALFLRRGLVPAERAERLPGSGVDIRRFTPASALEPEHATPRPPCFLLAARMLWDKGVGEFVAAARQLRAEFPEARFQLLGFVDARQRGAVPLAEIEQWQARGWIEYLGATDDVVPYLRAADCVVLPSYYREGVPRILLEAACMGKPVIAADTPGCRDTVLDGVTGYLCRPRDSDDLAARMRHLLALPPRARLELGRRGRELMLARFDERQVLGRYQAVLGRLAPADRSTPPVPPPQPAGVPPQAARRRVVALFVALIALAGLSSETLKPRADAPLLSTHELEDFLPVDFAGWRLDARLTPLSADSEQLFEANRVYDWVTQRTYTHADGARVMLVMAYNGRQMGISRAHRQELCYQANGAEILDERYTRVATALGEVPVMHLHTLTRLRHEPVTYWFTVGERAAVAPAHLLYAQVRAGLSGAAPDGFLVRVSSLSAQADSAYALHTRFIQDLIAELPQARARRIAGLGGA